MNIVQVVVPHREISIGGLMKYLGYNRPFVEERENARPRCNAA